MNEPTKKSGDDDPNVTLGGVGWVLSHWEHLELQFSILSSIFDGRPRTIDAMQEYGKRGRIFDERIQGLEKAADRYFRSAPDQSLEGTLAQLASDARKVSIRRHQIAHGIVSGMMTPNDPEKIVDGDSSTYMKVNYWVMPPIYAVLRRNGSYFYGSAAMREIAENIAGLTQRVIEFSNLLSAEQSN
jgi:hypothetical protein